MNIDRLKYLFWQRYTGKITPEEEQEFAVFVKEPENQALLETCIEAFLEQSPDLPLISQEKAEGILSRILSPMAVPSLSRPASLSGPSVLSGDAAPVVPSTRIRT